MDWACSIDSFEVDATRASVTEHGKEVGFALVRKRGDEPRQYFCVLRASTRHDLFSQRLLT